MNETRVGDQTIIHGDCQQELKRYENGFFDAIVTSPPYNLGMSYKTHNDKMAYGDYLTWLDDIFCQIFRVMHAKSSFFLNLGFNGTHPWVDMDVANIARRYFSLQNRFAWVKSLSRGDAPVTGHVKPINSERFVNRCWETVFHFTKNGDVPIDRLALGVPYADQSNLNRGNRGKNGDLRCRGNVWFLPYSTICCRDTERSGHQATFPVELAEYCIKLHGFAPQLNVLDPFLGIGTTLLACKKLGCGGIGMEIDASYCDLAISRLNEE